MEGVYFIFLMAGMFVAHALMSTLSKGNYAFCFGLLMTVFSFFLSHDLEKKPSGSNALVYLTTMAGFGFIFGIYAPK